ncbi:MAG: hypothetical protein HYU53_03945 [Acidobacteria bacterium]|nr:hypothetical protein [Acidobacteriota bacterium]
MTVGLMRALGRRALAASAAIAVSWPAAVVSADPVPKNFAASNVEAVGYSEIDGRPGFKMSIREVGGRWYLYMGHLWDRGWTIMDVTTPATPKVVKFVPGPDNTWTIQMEVHGSTMVTALQQGGAGWGTDPDKPFDEGFLIWDISDPVNPKRLGQWKTGGRGTHRNGYFGGRYVHTAAAMPGYEGQIYVIVDIQDPANPVEAGRWWVPGQHVAGGEKPPEAGISIHGPPMVDGNTAYLDYGAAGMRIVDISDIKQPKLIGALDFTPPFNSSIGVHSIMPMKGRNLVWVNGEAIGEGCNEPLPQASLIDISNPGSPRLMSTMPIPVPPPGAPYKNFCDKGGRFGPHNINQHQHHPDVEKQGNLMYATYFNAGLRVFDISDARLPKEVGYFVPPDPVKRYGPVPKEKLVVQTEDVLVDRRGYIYITNKNQGLWILRYTGRKPATANSAAAGQ